jgi:hypothetical protein
MMTRFLAYCAFEAVSLWYSSLDGKDATFHQKTVVELLDILRTYAFPIR